MSSASIRDAAGRFQRHPRAGLISIGKQRDGALDFWPFLLADACGKLRPTFRNVRYATGISR